MRVRTLHRHGCARRHLNVVGGLWPPFVPVVLEGQGYETQADADKDDEENAADILDADPITFVLNL